MKKSELRSIIRGVIKEHIIERKNLNKNKDTGGDIMSTYMCCRTQRKCWGDATKQDCIDTYGFWGPDPDPAYDVDIS